VDETMVRVSLLALHAREEDREGRVGGGKANLDTKHARFAYA
jgi:hypothetical protein